MPTVNKPLIKDLTPEQWKFLREFREATIQIGRSTEPIDRPRLEKAYRHVYKTFLNLDLKVVYWVDSPKAAKELFEREGVSTDRLYDLCRWSWDTYWESYLWFLCQLPLEYDLTLYEKLCIYLETQHGHIWWPCEEEVVAVEHPVELHVDERGRLHHTERKAIRYKDDFGFYFIEGVGVPSRIVTDPRSITIEEIRAERNAEIRRIMINHAYGLLRFLKDTGAKLVDERAGEKLFEDSEGAKFLICVDGSTNRIYELTVPRDTLTCAQAQESLGGLPLENIIAAS